jgi:hypothetical protein
VSVSSWAVRVARWGAAHFVLRAGLRQRGRGSFFACSGVGTPSLPIFRPCGPHGTCPVAQGPQAPQAPGRIDRPRAAERE